MIDRFCEGIDRLFLFIDRLLGAIDRLFLFIDRFGDYLIFAQLSSLYAQHFLSFAQRFIYKLILIEKKHGGSHSHCDSPCFLSAAWFR